MPSNRSLWCITGIFLLFVHTPLASLDSPLVLLISLDGLRYDFITPTLTPNIWDLSQKGVFAPNGIKSQVMTVTTPNHHCIATGLYQETHGIIDNTFYDPIFNEMYDNWNFTKNGTRALRSLSAHWYMAGTTIWRTNMQSRGRKSGCLNWPLGDAEYANDGAPAHKHTTWKNYGNFSDWASEIDQLLDWFTDPLEPINLGLYYISEPDHAQHEDDLYGQRVKQTIGQLDNAMGYLIKRLNDSNTLRNKVNLILTADHGHANIPDESYIFNISDYVDPNLVTRSGPSFFPRQDLNVTEDQIYTNLTKARQQGLHIQVWRKSEFPEKYHWKNNRRVGPIIFFFDLHYINEDSLDHKGSKHYPRGTHGYLNDYDQMKPFFVAHGPAFKSNYRLIGDDLVENVDIYPLMCKILNIKPAPNNGSLARIGQILKEDILLGTPELASNDITSTILSTKQNKWRKFVFDQSDVSDFSY